MRKTCCRTKIIERLLYAEMLLLYCCIPQRAFRSLRYLNLSLTHYNSYQVVFVNAQQNVDLYIKLHLLIKKGQFSQQLTITEENNINSGTRSP